MAPGTEDPRQGYSNALMTSLTRIMAEWQAPEFLTGVVAREGLDLDPGSIKAITFLANGGPRRPSELARHMVTGASNVSKILVRLGGAGLVERVPDPADARAALVTLTRSGRAVAGRFVRAGDSLVEDLLAGWSARDRQDLVRLLGQLEQSTTALSAQVRATPPADSHPEAVSNPEGAAS